MSLSAPEAVETGEIRGPRLRRALHLTTVAWIFGSVWMTAISGTPVTNYAKSLRASEFEFGVLAALPFIASLLSLPASLLIEATGQRKRIFLWGLYFQRLMWIPIGLLPLWMVQRHGMDVSRHAMILFLWLIFIMHAGQAVGGPAWTSWMADLVPDRARGKYFSRRRQWGILSAIPTAFVVGQLLDRHAQAGPSMLQWCAGIFIVAAFFGCLDIHLFHYIPSIDKPPQRGGRIFSAWREPLRNPQFVRFAGFVATMVFAISFMGQFVTLYILQNLGGVGGNRITQMMLIILPGVAQLFFFPVWGKAADRMGKRPLLILAGLGLVPVAVGWCFVTREQIWLGYVLAAAGAVLWSGVEVANLNLVLEMSGRGEGNGGGSGYVAVNSVIINVAGCCGGLAAGGLAQGLQAIQWSWVTPLKTFTFYDVLFVLSAVLRLLAVVAFVPFMHEPESRPTREALRYMTANIYNNLFNAVLLPLRLLGRQRPESYVPGQEH